MDLTNASLGPGGTNKRKAPEGGSDDPSALTCTSDHTDTMIWLQTILGDASYAQARAQLLAANAGAIDGEVLFSLENSAELKYVLVGRVWAVCARFEASNCGSPEESLMSWGSWGLMPCLTSLPVHA